MKQHTSSSRMFRATRRQYTSLFGLLLLVFVVSACAPLSNQAIGPNDTNTVDANGRVVMTVTDAAVNMGSISSVMMTVDTVALHSDAGGWVTVATPHKTYDLLSLKASGKQALLAELSLPIVRYDQVRLEVSGITVTDARGVHQASMPSSTLRFNGEIVVLEDKTATASIDFVADQSVYTAINGAYVFAPAIVFESRTDASADTSVTDNVRLSGGTLQSSTRVGMDVDGNLVVGGTLPPYLRIGTDGKISGTQNALNTNNTSIVAPVVNTQDPNSLVTP